ncbi:AlbA family DNA-binding domain-containing protein [Actinomadura geliboluensis]|nr:ATP-binding protein [Actinomadura geliboluensis]
MPFPLDDLSEPFRRPSELLRLARAVHAAGDYDETLWIEWKSRLDLDSDKGKLHLVKQILGFANRDPQDAVRWCKGNAYLLVGVEPNQLHGVTAVDPQVLSQSLRPYLGTKITWNPDYIDVDGAQVLVIEVAPPAPGDTIHFLMKDLFVTRTKQTACGPVTTSHGFNEGTIFVRRPGETERANRDERDMLLRRACSAPAVQLDAEVVADRQSIETAPLDDVRLAELIVEQRQELLAARYQPPTQDGRPVRPLFVPRRAASTDDPRTPEEYAKQIEDYLTRMQEVLRGTTAAQLEEHPAAHLALRLVNHQERPFAGVVVTVALPGRGVWCIDADDQITCAVSEYPDAPAPYGTPHRASSEEPWAAGTSQMLLARDYQAMARTQWRVERRDEDLQIIFDPVDLRAHARITLPPVPLFISPHLGSPLVVQWSAASMDTHGNNTGALALTLSPSTLSIIGAHQEPDSAPEPSS